MRNTLLSALFLAPVLGGVTLLSGCLAVAAGAVGIVVSQEFIDNAHVSYFKQDSAQVWATVKSTLSHMSTEPVDTDEDLKAAKARIDNAIVMVQVETYDVGETRVRVAAKKLMVYSGEIAEEVLRKIRRNLEEDL